MTIPLNRVVAFAGPYISLAAAAVATWLIAKANVLGVEGLDQSDLAEQIASALTFVLTAGLAWLGQAQWLKGHHQQITGDAVVQAAALANQPPLSSNIPDDPAHDALLALEEDLPDDDEEFGLPPDQDARVIPEFPDDDFDPVLAAPMEELAEAPGPHAGDGRSERST